MGLPIFFERSKQDDNRRDRPKRICSCHTCNHHASPPSLRPTGGPSNIASSARRRLMNLRAAQRRRHEGIEDRNVRPRLEDDEPVEEQRDDNREDSLEPSQTTLTELWRQPRNSDNIETLRRRILADLGSEAAEYINIRPDAVNDELVHIEMDVPEQDSQHGGDNTVVREAWRLLGGVNRAMNRQQNQNQAQDSRYITPPTNTLTPFTAAQHRRMSGVSRRSVSSSSTASTRTVGR